MYRQSCRLYVPSVAPGCPVSVCALAAGGLPPTQRARPSLLTRPPTLSSNPQMHSFLSSSHRLPSQLGSVCIARSLSFLFSFLVLSASPSSSRSPRAACSLVILLPFSPPPSNHPFFVPSLLTVSLRRVLKSVVKPGYGTASRAT